MSEMTNWVCYEVNKLFSETFKQDREYMRIEKPFFYTDSH